MVKVKVIKIFISISLLLLLGCSSRGPMESFFGPIETPNYSTLLIGTVVEKNETIISASEGTAGVKIGNSSFFQELIGGAVLSTESRLIFAEWSTDLLQYHTVYSINYADIVSYQKCKPLSSTLGLSNDVFCIEDGKNEFVFATKQVHSIFYQIKKKNPLAIN